MTSPEERYGPNWADVLAILDTATNYPREDTWRIDHLGHEGDSLYKTAKKTCRDHWVSNAAADLWAATQHLRGGQTERARAAFCDAVQGAVLADVLTPTAHHNAALAYTIATRTQEPAA